MLQSAVTKGKKTPTTYSLTLLLSPYLYHFLSPDPLFQSDPSIVPSFSSVLAAAIQGLQGSRGLKVSLEQSPPNAEHCAWLSSTVINPLPPLPATLGSFSSRTHIPLARHVESQKLLKYFWIYYHSCGNRNIWLFCLNQYRVLSLFLFFFKDMPIQQFHCQALQKCKQRKSCRIILAVISVYLSIAHYKRVSLVLFDHISPPSRFDVDLLSHATIH